MGQAMTSPSVIATTLYSRAVKPYVRMARADHWFKNVFMLPGIALAVIFLNIPPARLIWPTVIGVLSTCLIASANYVINEWLDAEFDKHHPLKRHRPSVTGNVQAKYVFCEYVALAALGFGLASLLTREFLVFSVRGVCTSLS